ncbi:type II secretion system protein GspJ [Bdellovibrio svalbardensis]|uniref:Type II secretion system protein J n=1 Tax=Bdellovibrio svalbardensis TaxID=2972972 RepID=A0ABT6DQL1_9BACT|nr:type II secretion system protein GspJ [Bdellovibrio svalbardensis]MDG0817443.1 prepilin-type N-terminal cleavage/methylation domain-containing protein [Bdellovibrio svalbardensis]
MKRQGKFSPGFTLIEVMITITILGTLTVLAAQAIQQAIKAKGKLQSQIDDVSRMRDAVRLMERDINLAYHYRDIEKEMQALVKKQASSSTTNPPPGGVVPQTDPYDPTGGISAIGPNGEQREVPRVDPVTNLVGTNETLNFVTMNNARTVKNTKQADFVEVGYALKECKSLREDRGNSKCLWRRSTPYVDLDVTKGGDEVVLMENVSEFKLRYIGKGKQDWVNDWRTDAQGDGATKGKFPQAVEISVTVNKKEGTKNKKYSMQVVVPIHFPNNPEENANGQGTGQGMPTSFGLPTK